MQDSKSSLGSYPIAQVYLNFVSTTDLSAWLVWVEVSHIKPKFVSVTRTRSLNFVVALDAILALVIVCNELMAI